MSDMQKQMKLHQQIEEERRSDDVFYRLLRSTQDEPLSTSTWVEVVNLKHGYTSTAIEESIEKGYVTIRDDQIVRLTEDGTKWLADYKKQCKQQSP